MSSTTGDMAKPSLKSVTAKYNSFCLQGDVLSGYRFLSAIKNPSPGIKRLHQRVEKLFFSENPRFRFKTKIPWVRKVLRAYAEYYVEVLARKIEGEKAEAELAKKIGQWVFGIEIEDVNQLEVMLTEKFCEIGWHFLGGVTYPFRGPYIYEEQLPVRFEIELPLGSRELVVNFMRKFHSLSWLNFATFGKVGTGGWAKPEGLYCVVEGYETSSERFRINYLKHEAQHFDDYVRFPFLLEGHQVILEYRAKLVELIYAETLSSFFRFMHEARNDRHFPHLLASHRLKKQFMQKLRLETDIQLDSVADLDLIKKYALEIYEESSAMLNSRQCK